MLKNLNLAGWRTFVGATCIVTITGIGALSAVNQIAVPSIVNSVTYIHNNWPGATYTVTKQ